MDNMLPLTAVDMAARKSWAKGMLLRTDVGSIWDSIIFSDEKKWNLDGPDGFQHYWRDLRQPARQTKRRQAGGGSVMVWAAFSARGKSPLVVLNGRQNLEDYVRDFFNEEGIQMLDWPSKSPDLSPIENLLSIMSRQVYYNGKQLERVSDLETALFDAWDAIPHDTLVSLVRSMPRRCVEVVEKEGNKTHY
uniref:Transposable element Tc3 transposase putative n=1 Tax=Albugo laibachii Nc14 TaxID=890382 RepID=F0WVI2_9STRA|nr:Transposable element Tc3 transposase putative [Albugo laibachii Nc14]|eukprot:CCA25424.1 Transposable element Tc3 transposase putative [Albugo laibachii Nc14]